MKKLIQFLCYLYFESHSATTGLIFYDDDYGYGIKIKKGKKEDIECYDCLHYKMCKWRKQVENKGCHHIMRGHERNKDDSN